jgi:hypothetical protein
MLKINQTLIRKTLLESLVNPNIPGPWRTIVDMKDPEFYRKRAIECLQEATWNDRNGNMKKAITLIALAQIFNRNEA